MLEITWIKTKVMENDYFISKHADDERQNDNLTIQEIEEAISNGIVIENYENSGRGESCLLAGFTKKGKPIHAFCGTFKDSLVVITVYIPGPPKFKNIFERG
ncbi:MAG: DUF4258 domain-containing protein [Ignavibacteriaceae bacterium]|nr:DUF4258 domain-containing protein [Ignavibacteriaceae bacterium]